MAVTLGAVGRSALALIGNSVPARLSISLALLLPGCVSDAPGMGEMLVRDSAGITIVENPNAFADRPFDRTLGAEPLVDIGVVDGAPEYQFFRVTSATRLDNGTVVVANGGTQELRFFDSAGTFLKTVGGRGRGPGEYELPVLVRSPFADSLIVFDPFQNRFSVLNSEGHFIRVITPGERVRNAIGMVQDGKIVTTDNTASAGFDAPEGLIENRVVVEIADLASPQRDTIGIFIGPDFFLWNQAGRIGFTTVPFDVGPSVAVRDERVHVTPGRVPEIHEFDLSGSLRRVVRVRRQREPITREQFDAFVDAQVERADDESEAAELRRRYGNTPMRAALPSYTRLIVDSNGNVWAERYLWPEGDSAIWTIFSPAGEALGVIALPAGVRIQGLSDGFLIATRRDELDVEHVVVWELVPTTR